MRVAHLITGLGVGGAENMLANLLERRGSGLECRVICMTAPGPVADRLRAIDVPVVSLGMHRGRPGPGGFARALRELRGFSPQVLQTWLYHADLLGTLLWPLVGRPALVWNLRCADMELQHYGAGTRAVRSLLARLSSRPDAVLANSFAARRFHAAIGYRPRRFEVIGNAFDCERFRPSGEARARLRASLGLGEGVRLVGMVARVDPAKDHATLLRAATLVAARRPDFHLLMVGDGLDTLRDETAAPPLAGRVSLLRPRPDIEQVYPALDVAVLSSAFGESFPNVLGEAMACAVPCVSTDVGDARELLGDTGLVVPRRDAAALAEGLLQALDWSDRERAARGRAAREKVREAHAPQAVAQRYEDLYRSLCAERR